MLAIVPEQSGLEPVKRAAKRKNLIGQTVSR
jgi:hypothetical protein